MRKTYSLAEKKKFYQGCADGIDEFIRQSNEIEESCKILKSRKYDTPDGVDLNIRLGKSFAKSEKQESSYWNGWTDIQVRLRKQRWSAKDKNKRKVNK